MRTFLLTFLYATSTMAGSLYTEAELWSKRDIVVCFASGEKEPRELNYQEGVRVSDWFPWDKASVKKWATSEFSLKRTGINFSGWKNCKDEAQPDLVVFYGSASILAPILGGIRAESIVGPDYALGLKGFPHAQAYVWLRSDGIHRGVVAHEFGHALGLHHEHMRLEAFNDSKCAKEDDAGRGLVQSWARRNGDYDSDSIMSYCQLHGKGGKDKGLSEGDIRLLRFLYP